MNTEKLPREPWRLSDSERTCLHQAHSGLPSLDNSPYFKRLGWENKRGWMIWCLTGSQMSILGGQLPGCMVHFGTTAYFANTHSICARCCSRHLTNTNLFNPHNPQPREEVSILQRMPAHSEIKQPGQGQARASAKLAFKPRPSDSSP